MAPHKGTFHRRVGNRLSRFLRLLRVPRLLALPVALSLIVAVPVAGYTATQVIKHVAAQTHGSAAARAIGRADVHLDTDTFEVNVSITQTENACQAPLNGQLCMRYSITANEAPVESGYGLIPNGHVTMTSSSISVSVDTSTGRFHHVVGKGGPVSVTWTWQPGSSPVTAGGQTSTLSPAVVQGSVIGRTLKAPGLVGSVLLYSSG